MRVRMLCLVLLLAATALPSAALQSEAQSFDVYFRGIKGGTMTLKASRNGNRYDTEARVKSGGLVGFFTSFEFRGRAVGVVMGSGALRPDGYSAVAIDGDTRRTVEMRYQGGRPARVALTPPRKPRRHDIAAQDQAGTLDPISATLSLLHTAPAGEACGQTVEVFDGTRRSRLSLARRAQAGAGDLWVCRGVYRRVAGFRPKDIAEKPTFDFRVFFREGADGMMRVESFETDTLFGRARAVRR